MKTLAKQIQREGFIVRSHKRGSGKLHFSTVQLMLRNKFYIGIIDLGFVWNQLIKEMQAWMNSAERFFIPKLSLNAAVIK